ncbi:MAG: hypothetical protein M3235_19185, partial [Actinomycetota bacterium]|nr:hypothetical protein [Actinomycetota bacterium]
PAVLTAALAAHCDVIAGPADAERRRAQAGEIAESARAAGDAETELLGRRLRLVATLERGDYGAADLEIDAFALRVATVRHPLYAWFPPLWRAMRLVMVGRFDEVDAQRAVAEAAGARVGSVNARLLTAAQRYFAAAESGRFAEGHTAFAAVEDLGYTAPELTITQALAEAQAGLRDAARRRLDLVSPRLTGLPIGSEWVPAIVQVAELVAWLGGHPAARWAYDRLLPHRARHAIEGIGAYSHGSVERHLGLLAGVLGERDAAREHFAAALAANETAGATLLVARTLRDAGVALGDTAQLARAREAYRALGVEHRVAELGALLDPAVTPDPGTGVFRRCGETWTLTWNGVAATVRDGKGMRDLARLLATPDTDIAAVDLAGTPVAGGDTGELVDRQARDAYRARLAVLDGELAAADNAGDARRSARAAEERDALVAQLSAAYGIGGRARRTGDPAERARSAVGWRIRDALRRIEAAHPELARHLRHSVRTGAFCRYAPETPVRWEM